MRAGLRQAAAGLPAQPRGLLPGLVDGDTSQLDPVLADRFRVAGLTHLVAVSGTNCSIAVGAIALTLRRLRASPRLTAALSAVALIGFVVLARPSPSVLRAAAMAGIALLGLAFGRQRDALPGLAAATLALLVWHPTLATDLGFALSVAATAALLLIAPGWAAALERRGVPAGLGEAFAVAAAAHVVTAPIIAGISGRISLVAIPANILAEPVVAVTTVLGLLAAIASVIWLPAAKVLAELAGWPCRWLVWVGDHFGSLPGASLPWPAGVTGGLLLAAVTVALGWLCRRAAARSLLAVAVVAALVVQIPVRAVIGGWPPTGWLMVACDVGQGDGLVLNAGGGQAVVIDTGPDPVAMDRCLRELGVRRIRLLVLSHYHLDHVGGITGALRGRELDALLTSPLADPDSGHRLVLNAIAGTGVRPTVAAPGTSVDVGAVRLDVLGPAAAFAGTRSDPNNSSVILRATVAGFRILLPGDAEVEAQDALLAAGVDLRADLLKVPHHGSAYSDPAFLQAVRPQLAVISVGRDNDYGHPSPLLLAELDRLGVPSRRTDRDGDVAVVADHGRLLPVLHATRTGNALSDARYRDCGPSRRRDTMVRCRPPPSSPTSFDRPR